MKSNILDMESHQSCEDEGLGDKAEGGDGDEEDKAEDDEKMSASVLSHRPNQVEKEQVLENILLLSINFFNKITRSPGERGEDIPGSSSEDKSRV